MGNVFGSAISMIWDKLHKACRWMIYKIEKCANYLSQKFNNLVNQAKRYYDNLTESLKESVQKAKRRVDDLLEKIKDSVASLKKKLLFGAAITKEKIIQIANLARSTVRLTLHFLEGTAVSCFIALMEEVSRKIRKFDVWIKEIKNVMLDKDGDLDSFRFLAEGLLQLLNVALEKPTRIPFVVLEASNAFAKDANRSIGDMRKTENAEFKILDSDERRAAVFVYFSLQLSSNLVIMVV